MAFGPAFKIAKALLLKHEGDYANALHEAYNKPILNNPGPQQVHAAMNELSQDAGMDNVVPHDWDAFQTKQVLDYVKNNPGIMQTPHIVDTSKLNPMVDSYTHPEPKLDWPAEEEDDLDDNLQGPDSSYPFYAPVKEQSTPLEGYPGTHPDTWDLYIPSTRHDLYHPPEFYKSLPLPERDTARAYAASSFTVNMDLRISAGEVAPEDLKSWRPVPEAKRPIVQRRVQLLDNLIAKAPPVAKPAVLYRGVDHDFWQKKLYHIKPGDTLTDAAFVSTSVNKSVAYEFANVLEEQAGMGSSGAVLEIVVQPGAKAFAMGPFGLGHEEEVLLPRGSRFKVLKVDRAKRKITVEHIRAE